MPSRLPILLVAAVFLGCASPDAPESTTTPRMRALGEIATVESGGSDEAIGREVRRRLVLVDPQMAAAVIVEVSDGVVTLRGTVPNLAAAWKAEAAATSTPGTKVVQNDLIARATAGE